MIRSQQGFSHLIIFLVIALVVGVGLFAGYRITQLNSDDTTASSELTEAQQAMVDDTPELKAADTALNEVADELSDDLDVSVLDEDIEALY